MPAISKAFLNTAEGRPVESHSGAQETIIVGPYQSITTSFCMRRDQDAEGVKREETWRGMSPHYPTSGLWERHKLPSENGFNAYLRSEKKGTWNTFQYFERWWGPQTSRGLGKLSPLVPHLDGPGWGHNINRPTTFVEQICHIQASLSC